MSIWYTPVSVDLPDSLCSPKNPPHPFTHPLTYALIHPIHSPIHLLTHSLIHPPIHSSTYLCTHPPTYSLTHPPTYSPTHPPTYSLTHPPTHSLIHLPAYSLTFLSLFSQSLTKHALHSVTDPSMDRSATSSPTKHIRPLQHSSSSNIVMNESDSEDDLHTEVHINIRKILCLSWSIFMFTL